MGRIAAAVILIGLVVVAVVGSQSLYTVDEINYAVVQQFGKIQAVKRSPGLKIKTPFIQQVTYLDKRLLTSDTSAQEYLTDDQKRIQVDQVTRWKISDPRKFFLRFPGGDASGRARLEQVVLGALREKIAQKPYDVMISAERDDIMVEVRNAVQARSLEDSWGIEVVDVRTKRADLPAAVERSVYDRMSSARKVEADRHRAQGQLRSDQITSETDRLVTIMAACAGRVSKETRGAGEAAAIAIFAQALQQDPEFFSFIRRLEAYQTSFSADDRLVMSTDSNFFQLLSGQAVPIPEIDATEGPVTRVSESVVAPLGPVEIDALIERCIPEGAATATSP